MGLVAKIQTYIPKSGHKGSAIKFVSEMFTEEVGDTYDPCFLAYRRTLNLHLRRSLLIDCFLWL